MKKYVYAISIFLSTLAVGSTLAFLHYVAWFTFLGYVIAFLIQYNVSTVLQFKRCGRVVPSCLIQHTIAIVCGVCLSYLVLRFTNGGIFYVEV